MSWEIRQGDALTVLREMDAGSVQTCVTSPPYWGLRDYGVEGQLGLEPTPEEYVANLVAVFREVHRVLRGDGTVWLNLGDSYAGLWGAPSRGGPPSEASTLRGNGHIGGGPKAKSLSAIQIEAHPKGRTHTGSIPPESALKPKDLVGIPWRVAFALQADGWWLRSDIIWAKPNPMPESVTDRPTRSHEYIFLLTKSARYFYDADAVREAHEPATFARSKYDLQDIRSGSAVRVGMEKGPKGDGVVKREYPEPNPAGRNKRSVWTVTTQPFSWRQNARRVRVAPDEVSDDTMRSTSPSCPVHGGRPAPAPTVADDGREGDGPSRSERSDARHVQESLDGRESTDRSPAPGSGGDSSDSPRLSDSPTATAHSRGGRKMASRTASGGTACEETTAHTEGTSPSNGLPASGGSDTHDSSQTLGRTAHKSTCTCEYYVLEETDHFATFPPKLIEPCILAGSPPKCCGECGAPWERVRERQDLRHWTERRTDRKKWDYGQGHGRNDGGGSFEGDDGITLGWRPSCDCGSTPEQAQSVVLDIFCGSGTTGVVALRHNRDFIGIELNPDYCEMARNRIRDDAPLFNHASEVA